MVDPRAERASSGGRSMCGSACASAPPTVATLRTRTLESVRSVRAMTGQPLRTASDFSSARREVIAPMLQASPVGLDAVEAELSQADQPRGRSTPAFIISISAVPPESGRASSPSSSAIASASESGSASSNGAIEAILLAPPGGFPALVLEHDALVEQLLADAVRLGVVLALARREARVDFLPDPARRRPAAARLQERLRDRAAAGRARRRGPSVARGRLLSRVDRDSPGRTARRRPRRC